MLYILVRNPQRLLRYSSHIFQISIPPSKKYREGHEFEKTKKVLGSGNSAGDIIVVKDKKTGAEHAQKTVSFVLICFDLAKSFEPLQEKNNSLHMRKQRRRSAVQ